MIVQTYYMTAFVLSFILTVLYAYIWHKHFGVYFTLIFTLIPLVNLGYVFSAFARDLGSAVTAQKIIYLGGCFLIFFIMLNIFNLCQIGVSRAARTLTLVLIAAEYGFVLTIGHFPFFYREVSFRMEGARPILERTYGPMHTVFYFMVIACFVISIAAIVYSYLHKQQVSRKILILLFIPEVVSFVSYFSVRILGTNVEMVPASYVFAQIMYLGIAHRISLYDIDDTVVDSILQAGETGFVSFDFKNKYLGSTSAAQQIVPELADMTVDHSARKNAVVKEEFITRLEKFQENEEHNRYFLRSNDGEKIYAVNIQYLYDDKKKKGYQFVITDDTQNQKYISLLNHYNEDLETEVQKKTENLIMMHNNLVLGMATMVESRDNSTGGHIRRTSEAVRILIGEMRKEEFPLLTEEFCRNLIKAAPMHDLGKIAVDDAVLRKPGRFAPEEYEAMKSHAAEGARIVHEILKETDDEDFRILAENVAHYHHERWDGSGYPERLAGEEIPFEARIMAIADVYDALVSRRVYKEAMSFEKADRIMLDGMGTQFDKGLKGVYVNARPKLEAFYTTIREEEKQGD